MRSFISLVAKEVSWFFVIPVQTLVAPVVSAFLQVVIFGIVVGQNISFPYYMSYREYLISGLVIMSVLFNAFQNTTSSIVIAKYRLYIVDIVTYPLSRHWLVLGFGIGGMVRGLMVGGLVWLMGLLFAPGLSYSLSLWMFLLSASLGGLLFAMLGTWLAFITRTFDQVAIYTNFIITPVLYLSGVFFPISLLPDPWKTISQYNPIVYLIETARYALTGSQEVHLAAFFVWVPFAILVVWWGATRQLRKGVLLQK